MIYTLHATLNTAGAPGCVSFFWKEMPFFSTYRQTAGNKKGCEWLEGINIASDQRGLEDLFVLTELKLHTNVSGRQQRAEKPQTKREFM